MRIETEYSPGDVVWKVWNGYRKVWAPCAFCGQSGEIEGADGTRRSCPECFGRGGSHESQEKAWHVEGKMTVGQVRVQITASPGIDQIGSPFEFDNYKPQTSREEQYMCVETGIGSGALHDVADLYATEDAALAACEERNADTMGAVEWIAEA